LIASGAWVCESRAEKRVERFAEKHSHAVSVKAKARKISGRVQHHHVDAAHCGRPDIDRFVDMACDRKPVFEFTMHETTSGRVRNHGYP
jgi:hypothetical protein